MKKILALILALMLVISMFAGCSDEEEPQKPEEENNGSEIIINDITRTFTAVIYDRGEDEAFWNAVKAAFEAANTGVTVNMIVTKDAAYEVRDRILAGNSPDFVFLPSTEESGVTEALIKDKAMTALTDIESSMPAGIFENSACRPYEDGVTYLAPFFYEEKGLIYNVEKLSSNGFTVPATWDDFIAIAEGCKNKNFEFFTYAGAEPDEFVEIFAAALEPVIGTEELGKLLACEEEAWKNENVKTFVEKIEKITKLVVSGSSTKSKDDTISDLKDGKALFVSGTASDLEELNKDGEKYAICKYPAISGTATKTVSFSEMYIPVEAKEAELAKSFISFLYGSEAGALMKEHLGTEGYGNGEKIIAPEFIEKTAENTTLSDEFCDLVVAVFKGNANSGNFADKMIEYIKEF